MFFVLMSLTGLVTQTVENAYTQAEYLNNAGFVEIGSMAILIGYGMTKFQSATESKLLGKTRLAMLQYGLSAASAVAIGIISYHS